ncbi:hypothetical protein [Nocardioides sp. YIM 152588]|uniref:hypothetical protein n=1 Tax=Nocardioides sp. YIM 152588 TaxID=3158259 RepID=UPI0032E40AF8
MRPEPRRHPVPRWSRIGAGLAALVAVALATTVLTTVPTRAAGPPPLEVALYPDDLHVAYGGHLYFYADDGVHGRELWRTRGTAASTGMVVDTNPGNASSHSPYEGLVATDDGLILVDGTGDVGIDFARLELGGGAPTIDPIVDSFSLSRHQHIATLGDRALFASGTSNDLLVLDAGDSSVSRVGQVRFLSGSLGGAVLDGRAYFVRSIGSGADIRSALWRSNGNAGATTQVFDFRGIDGSDAWDPVEIVATSDRVYFTVEKTASDYQLWSTDGTTGGTTKVADHRATHLRTIGKRLYYRRYDGATDRAELWTSTGTGSVRLAAAQSLSDPTPVAKQLAFIKNGAIWRTRGTRRTTIKTHGGIYAQQITSADPGTQQVFYQGTQGIEIGLAWQSGQCLGTARKLGQYPTIHLPMWAVGGRLFATRSRTGSGDYLPIFRQIKPRRPVIKAVDGPRLTGPGKPGTKLRLRPGRWKPSTTTLAFRWLVNGKRVKGASGKRFPVRRAHRGKRVQGLVLATAPCAKPVKVRTKAVRVR